MARKEIIEADNLVVLLEESFDEIGADEAGSASDEDSRVLNFSIHSKMVFGG